MRKRPEAINYLGPMVTYFFTAFAGTGHVAYSLLPIIAEVSTQVGVRPERPLAVSTLAAHLGICASPISAATVLLLAQLANQGVTLIAILAITVPSTFFGLMLAALVNQIRPLPPLPVLDPAPEKKHDSSAHPVDSQALKKSRRAVGLFALAILTITVFGAFSGLRPSWVSETGRVIPLEMTTLIEILMLSTTAIMVFCCQLKVDAIVQQKTFLAGIKAVIAIFGIAWLGDTYFSANMTVIAKHLEHWLVSMPWLFGVALFFMSAMLFSQAATIRAILPLGLSLGLPIPTLIGLYPAVNGLFFIPGYPIELAAINFDRTGSTHIGRFIVNHSFMIPGLVGVGGAVSVGLLGASLFYT